MTDFAPPYPHDPIEQIDDDVFMARGSIKMNALTRITRNMAIIRHEGELTLIDPLRLNSAEEAKLDTLGTVTNIIRLGAFHGLDDPYYVDRYDCKLWAQEGGTTYPKPEISVTLSEATKLPFPDGKLLTLNGTVQPESVLLLKRGKGLLLTCDAIQHYGDYSNNNFLARLLMPFIGFPKKTIVGPIWLKVMTPEGKSLESEFHRILELDFDRLLSAHGTLIERDAHSLVAQAINTAFSEKKK